MTERIQSFSRSEEGLRNLCREIAKKYWHLDFPLPVTVNKRLRRSYGRYVYHYVRNGEGKVIGYKPDRIEVSEKAFKGFHQYQMMDLLKHEVCHWACHVSGKPWADGSEHFESELRRINASSTGVNMFESGYKEKSILLSNRKLNEKKKKKDVLAKGSINNLRIFVALYRGKFRYFWREDLQDYEERNDRGAHAQYMKYREYYLFTFHFNGASHTSGIGKREDGKWAFQHANGIYRTEKTSEKLYLSRAMKNKLKTMAIAEIEKQGFQLVK